ncbi:MAG TPA: beta-ketoacyl-ACP synthase II [Rubricoccaceae bacterium]|nr:beta-ketoacyl-ACP synthase II [Rubricoccaceae bacterium]
MPVPGPRIVVTGLGAVTPIGLSVPALWEGMMRGESGAGPITYFDASDFSARFACELKGFDAEAHIDRKEARRLDRYAQYAVVAAEEAIRDAGLAEADEATRRRVGVVFGSGIGGIKTFQDQVLAMGEGGPRRISPFLIPMQISDIAAGVVAMRHRFMGPNYATVSACATSNNAIGDAWMILKAGLTDAMVCGGSEAAIVEIAVGGFAAMRALSTRNDSPETASRPFDATRDGFVMGEGGGALVLETLERAQARGARIYAEMVGLGMSADAYHMTAPHPDGDGAVLAMQMALASAGLAPEDVDYLNMHGTSTPLGDVAETKAVKTVFGEHAYRMNLSSTKSMMGHLLGAAGAVEAIASVLAVVHDRVPPTINFETPDPECDLNYTFNAPQERTVDVALSNGFGFGGHNTCVVFKKFEG